MKIKYATEKIEQQCTSIKEAIKLFGGDKKLAMSLLSRINLIQNAEVIKDIIVMPQLHFHNLHGNREGYFAIDVKSRKDKWRIILCLLNEEEVFTSCHIDEVAGTIKIIEITEVSPHYE